MVLKTIPEIFDLRGIPEIEKEDCCDASAVMVTLLPAEEGLEGISDFKDRPVQQDPPGLSNDC
jgi:hypothetical protein